LGGSAEGFRAPRNPKLLFCHIKSMTYLQRILREQNGVPGGDNYFYIPYLPTFPSVGSSLYE